MEYRGYHIYAEVDVTYKCDFELNEQGELTTLSTVDTYDLDVANLYDFAIYNEDDDFISTEDTIEAAKSLVDQDIEDNNKPEV